MKFILSVAVGIILIHGIVSHEHNANTSETLVVQSHECNTSLFEGVKLTFSLDHGDGHLEQFVKVPFEMPKLLLLKIVSIAYTDNTQHFIAVATELNYASRNLPPDPLRGPPC